MYDKYSGRSRRFGFVTMKTVEDANAVAEKLNGTVSFFTWLHYFLSPVELSLYLDSPLTRKYYLVG